MNPEAFNKLIKDILSSKIKTLDLFFANEFSIPKDHWLGSKNDTSIAYLYFADGENFSKEQWLQLKNALISPTNVVQKLRIYLKHLSSGINPIDFAILKEILTCPNCTIKHLNIGGQNPKESDWEILSTILQHKNNSIYELSLHLDYSMTDNLIILSKGLMHSNNKVKLINFQYNYLTSIEIDRIAQIINHPNSQAESLNLRYTHLDDKAIAQLVPALQNNNKLRFLALDGNHIGRNELNILQPGLIHPNNRLLALSLTNDEDAYEEPHNLLTMRDIEAFQAVLSHEHCNIVLLGFSGEIVNDAHNRMNESNPEIYEKITEILKNNFNKFKKNKEVLDFIENITKQDIDNDHIFNLSGKKESEQNNWVPVTENFAHYVPQAETISNFSSTSNSSSSSSSSSNTALFPIPLPLPLPLLTNVRNNFSMFNQFQQPDIGYNIFLNPNMNEDFELRESKQKILQLESVIESLLENALSTLKCNYQI